MRRFLIIVGFLPIFLALFLSKNTFASQKNIYISRVYATNGREFVEIFNSGEDYKFQEISIRNTQKQIEIANLKDGIFKSQSYITFSQNATGADANFKDEFQNVDTISQQPILGLYIDGELKDYICSDEKRCIAGYKKNSTDLKPAGGVEKMAVSKEEILKNGETMKPSEIKKGYDFSLRNFNDYLPKTGGLVLNDKKIELDSNFENSVEKPIETLKNTDESDKPENTNNALGESEELTMKNEKDDNLAEPEIDSISENNNLNLIDENKIDDKRQNADINLTEKNKKPSVKDDFSKPKINFEEKNNKTTIQSKNKTKILAPNTGFNQKNANFTLQILLLSAFEMLIVFKRRVLNEVF